MSVIWQRLLKNPWLPAALLFLLCGLRNIGLPGLYMDEVNPDYLAARVLHPGLHNPVFELPTRFFNILGNYYHGVQNYYLDIPVLAFLGSSVTSVRLAQMLFGVIIVSTVSTLVLRLTRSGALAMACGFALATDIAFVASFRDQNYIVLGGFAWLMVALLILFPKRAADDVFTGLSNRRIFASGVFCGLAAYGYFVQIFFYPAMLFIILKQATFQRRALAFWCTGVAIGLFPYVLGYLSMYLALGGLHPMMVSMHNGLNALQPMQPGSGLSKSVSSVFGFAKLAVTNHENELMTLGASLHSRWGASKFYLLAVSAVAMLMWLIADVLKARKDNVDLSIALLPLSYIAVGSIFGARLGAHHFSVMTPMTYLLATLLLARILGALRQHRKHVYSRILLTVIAAFAVSANFLQQQGYFNELQRTGGVGRASNALTTLAEEAMTTGGGAIYAFPEWGFFMSFALLTENRVPYLIDISPSSIAAAHVANADRYEIRLVYWNEEDRAAYTTTLETAGATAITDRDFLQRDGKKAFHMLTGHFDEGTVPAGKK